VSGRVYAIQTAPADLVSSHEGSDSVGADLLALYQLLLSQRSVAQEERQSQITRADKQRDVEIQEEKQARIDEANAERSGGGFFGDVGMFVKHAVSDTVKLNVNGLVHDVNADVLNDPQFWKDLEVGAQEIGKWAAVVGSVALAGATFGAGSVVAALVVTGAVLSTAGAAQSSFHLLEKAGVDSTTAGWIGIGLSLGGAACSGAGGIVAATRTAAASSSAVTSGLRAASTTTEVGAGASTVVAGGAHIVVAGYDKQAKLAVADEQQAQSNIKHIDTEIEHIIEALQQAYESTAAQMESVRSAEKTNAGALLGIAAVRV
jgi:hypothetical protein